VFRRFRAFHYLMNTDHSDLSAMLQRWAPIEPSAGFENRVRRRLAEPAPADEPLGWLRPVSAMAALALAAFVASRGPTAGPSIPRDSLTASYVRMVSGGAP
jgi:hypothetical protein